jgi:hypothetical protein
MLPLTLFRRLRPLLFLSLLALVYYLAWGSWLVFPLSCFSAAGLLVWLAIVL